MRKIFIVLLVILFLMIWAYLMFMPKEFIRADRTKMFEQAEEDYQKFVEKI